MISAPGRCGSLLLICYGCFREAFGSSLLQLVIFLAYPRASRSVTTLPLFERAKERLPRSPHSLHLDHSSPIARYHGTPVALHHRTGRVVHACTDFFSTQPAQHTGSSTLLSSCVSSVCHLLPLHDLQPACIDCPVDSAASSACPTYLRECDPSLWKVNGLLYGPGPLCARPMPTSFSSPSPTLQKTLLSYLPGPFTLSPYRALLLIPLAGV